MAAPLYVTPNEGDRTPLEELWDLLHARPAWMADALCQEYRDLPWIPERGQDVTECKLVCARCLAAPECRQWALDQGPELKGIWGALSERQRKALRPDQPGLARRVDRGLQPKPPPRRAACGTISGYVSGCRCDDCRRARASYMRAWRAARPGRSSTDSSTGPAVTTRHRASPAPSGSR